MNRVATLAFALLKSPTIYCTVLTENVDPPGHYLGTGSGWDRYIPWATHQMESSPVCLSHLSVSHHADRSWSVESFCPQLHHQLNRPRVSSRYRHLAFAHGSCVDWEEDGSNDTHSVHCASKSHTSRLGRHTQRNPLL